jgi:sugar lactone lactonase YvrE
MVLLTTPELVLDARAALGESPVWDPATRSLLWADLTAGVVHRFDPATGTDDALDVGGPVGAVAPTTSGRVLLAAGDGFLRLDPATGGVEEVAVVEGDDPRTTMNDGACDPAGRFWAGSKDVEGRRPIGTLYRLGPDLEPAPVVRGVTVSNGLAWAPDGTTMYYIDSPTHAVDAFDFAPATGEATDRRRMASLPESGGLPDGMTVDEEGFLWVAFWGGSAVRRLAPDGRVVAEVRFPARLITSCAFGGPDLGDLYVTSARIGLSDADLRDEPAGGGLFRVRPGVRGLPPAPFDDGGTR